ncbi:MAG TPA: Hsp20/alpha crystallin family protein [Patescibacteria group bacterium]|nr:Hsp20/alpha crystallin family protein [Patescibacteria group bacterium]
MARGRLFGKFMGGSADEEVQQEDITEEDDTNEEQTAGGEMDEEGEAVSVKARGRSRKPARVEVVEDEAAGGSADEREEWINEYEGQLTLDVYQTKDNVIIKSTIAGVKAEDLDITIANDMVTIKGDRKKEEEVRSEDYFYQECYWGSFSRSIILPVDIDVEGVTAEIKDGILTVTLPKAAKAKTKKIKVRGGVE